MIELKMYEKKAKAETKGEYSFYRMNELLNEKRQKLMNRWHDRLAGVPKTVDVWYQVLSTRQLY